MKRWINLLIPVLLVLTLAVSGCGSQAATATDATDQESNTYVPVSIEPLAKQTLTNVTTLSGKINPDEEIMVLPKTPGKVEKVNVKVGDKVNKGDILFSLDKEDIQKQVDQAKAAYDLANANYQKSIEQLNIAKKSLVTTKPLIEEKIKSAQDSLERTKTLYENDFVSKVDYDQAVLSTNEAISNLNSQLDQAELAASDTSTALVQAQLNQAKVGYDQAKDALGNASITAPITGYVTEVTVEVGAMASNAQPAMTLVAMDTVYASINITENIVNRLSQGQEAKITIPAVSDKAFTGTIESISPASDARTQLYPVKIAVSNKDGVIKAGMFAQVELNTLTKKDVMAVRSEAVLAKDNQSIVYVVEDGKAAAKVVSTGLDTGEYVEITQGLEPGDQVIIKGQNYVEDGTIVKVVGGTEA